MTLKTSDFDYHLPPELIADHPVHPRDSARMLVVSSSQLISCGEDWSDSDRGARGSGGLTPRRDKCISDSLSDHVFSELPSFLKAGDVLVMNNTKVIPARLMGRRGEAKVEITLNRPVLSPLPQAGEGWVGAEWEVFAKPAKRLKVGDTITFAADFCAIVTAKNEGVVTLKFELELIGRALGGFATGGGESTAFLSKLQQYGHMPLPPYIRKGQDKEEDKQDYQTVFAACEGAVAAPTAGLHFTDEIIEEIKAKGVKVCFVTLHVGGGTFLPVKSENIAEHKMHPEWFGLSESTANTINDAKANGGRVVAVGTTAVRVLESCAASDDARTRGREDAISFPNNEQRTTNNEFLLKAGTGETSIFIYPGYKFKIVDMLLTNFHLPKSTLLMLVSAFAGAARIKAAYAHAIKQKYRFYSYGDCCLLPNHEIQNHT